MLPIESPLGYSPARFAPVFRSRLRPEKSQAKGTKWPLRSSHRSLRTRPKSRPANPIGGAPAASPSASPSATAATTRSSVFTPRRVQGRCDQDRLVLRLQEHKVGAVVRRHAQDAVEFVMKHFLRTLSASRCRRSRCFRPVRRTESAVSVPTPASSRTRPMPPCSRTRWRAIRPAISTKSR